MLVCSVAESGRKRVLLDVLERTAAPRRDWEITLLQALPKGRGFEDIIEKATEQGVSRIIPLVTERTVAKPGADDVERKLEKWRHVAIEAIKQCGNPWLPVIEPPITPFDWMARAEPTELSIIGSLQPGSRPPRHYFDQYRGEHGRHPRSVAIWIGPEGDFTREETEAIVRSGARPVTLGKLVLRVETAAVASLAIINHELSCG
jgi:16S rRNA (uracil1498-N3)-methyltransferase